MTAIKKPIAIIPQLQGRDVTQLMQQELMQ